MSSPIEEITIICPNCQHIYDDWSRASLNLDLEYFDDEYIDECSSAVCPKCQHKVNFATLIVKGGVFYVDGNPEREADDDQT